MAASSPPRFDGSSPSRGSGTQPAAPEPGRRRTPAALAARAAGALGLAALLAFLADDPERHDGL